MENRQHGVNIQAEHYENFFIGGIANNDTRVKISCYIKKKMSGFPQMQRHIIIFSKGIPVGYAHNDKIHKTNVFALYTNHILSSFFIQVAEEGKVDTAALFNLRVLGTKM